MSEETPTFTQVPLQKKPKKRVLIFSTAYYPFYSGAEIAIKEITERLSDTYEFDLITVRFKRAWPKTEKIGAVWVYRVGFGVYPFLDKLLSPFFGALLTRKLQQKHPYDFFWTMMATFTSGAAYLAAVLQKNPVPIVLTLQEGDSEAHIAYKRFGLIGLSWKLALAHSTMVTVISTYLEKRARQFGFTKTIALIPNGVDYTRFTLVHAHEHSKQIRESHGIPLDATTLITTSRLSHKNAIDVVLHALVSLPGVHFLILGNGEDEKKLQALATRLGLTKRAHFVGFVEQEHIPAYLGSADIFIRPSRSEGQGISFLETMAAGVPIIATQVGGIADFLFDSVRNPLKEPTGFAVDVDSPEQIVDAVNAIVGNPNETARVVENAKQLVREHYDWNQIAKDINEQVFKRLTDTVP